MKLVRQIDIKTSMEEDLNIIRSFADRYPQAILILANNPKGYCPFPSECKKFPCLTLDCNGDTCSNGDVYRMS